MFKRQVPIYERQKSCESAAFLFSNVSNHVLNDFGCPEICILVRRRLLATKRAQQNGKIQQNPVEFQCAEGLYKGFAAGQEVVASDINVCDWE